MGRRKGELTRNGINRDWPHQVILPERLCSLGNVDIHDAFCRDLSRCPRGHSVFDNDQWHKVFCFAKREDADKFRARFGGEVFDPKRLRSKAWHLLKPKAP
jgi:hypothetical protein